MANMAATAEAAEMTEAAEMAAEGVAIVEAETGKIAAGAAVIKRKIARIPNPTKRPLALTAIFV